MRERAATDTLPILSNGELPVEPVAETYNVQVDPGAGPRHLAWSPNGKNAYLLSELSGQLFVLKYEEEKLSVIQTLQADTLNAGGSADVHVSPDGEFVYASHRLQGDGCQGGRAFPQGARVPAGRQLRRLRLCRL
jgi:DNA-binding beta-propeller fold protein YncE